MTAARPDDDEIPVGIHRDGRVGLIAGRGGDEQKGRPLGDAGGIETRYRAEQAWDVPFI